MKNKEIRIYVSKDGTEQRVVDDPGVWASLEGESFVRPCDLNPKARAAFYQLSGIPAETTQDRAEFVALAARGLRPNGTRIPPEAPPTLNQEDVEAILTAIKPAVVRWIRAEAKPKEAPK